MRNYVEKLVAKTKPKRVVINMLYFLDEKAGEAGPTPCLRGYKAKTRPSCNTDP